MDRSFWLDPLLLLLFALSAQASEVILISGGPAVRSFEKFKSNSHDKYWGNFIDSALQRVKDLQKEGKNKDKVVWLVFRPSYLSRGREDGQDYLKILEERGALVGAQPIYFDNKNQLLLLLRRDGSIEKPKISRLEYFGHSNKKCWMFDYSNRIDGGALEPLVLHVDDLSQISSSSFTPDAECISYGCHSGEEFSQRWRMIVGRPMIGAVGKTDYSDGGMPKITEGKGGTWVY